MKYIKNKKIILLIISVVFISFFSKIVFAAWNGLPYSPGTIDNPECLPSQTNCDVLPSLTNESDPIFIASQAFNISGVDILNWDTVYGWGNHSSQGYVTGTPWASQGYITDGNTGWDNSYGFITSYTETDPIFISWDKSTGINITESQISDLKNYLTTYTETDPLFISSQSHNITIADITNLSNLSGINTGDETNSSIKTKLGKATNSDDGYLSSTDWTTFNNKQPAGSYLTSYTETDPIFLTSPASSLSLSDLTDIGNLSGLNTGDQNLSGLVPYTGATTNVDLGANNLTVDTNSLFVDSVNHRVGIGTTTPNVSLDIKAAVSMDAVYIRASNGYQILKFHDLSNVARAWVGNDTGSRFQFKNFTSGGDLYITTTGTGNVIVDNGKVGIGTTTPTYQLQISDGTNNYITANKTNWSLKVGRSETDLAAKTLDISGDINFNPIAYPIHTGLTLSLAGLGAGNLSNGLYYYTITYYDAAGNEAVPQYLSKSITVVDKTTNGQVTLTNIPVSTDPRVVGRKIYRSPVNGNGFVCYLLTTIANNTATTYTDNTADASLGTITTYRRNNFTAGRMYSSGSVIMQVPGEWVTSLGIGALQSNTTGTSNVGIGGWAFGAVTSGSTNVGIGWSAGVSTNTGSDNTAIGYMALAYNRTGSGNIAIGSSSLRRDTSVTGVSNNIAIGASSFNGLYDASTYNVGVGYQAGLGTYTAISSYNIFLGGRSSATTLANGSNNVLIGYNADVPAAATSNFLNIGEVIYATGLGTGGSTPSTSGKVGIGTTNPATQLSVVGSSNGVNLLSLQNTSSGNAYTSIGFNNASGSAVGGFGYGGLGAISFTDKIYFYATGKPMQFSTNTGTNIAINIDTSNNTNIGGVLYTQLNGNVGIGTTGPLGKLDVVETTTFPKTLIGFRRPGFGDWGITLGSETISNVYIGYIGPTGGNVTEYFWRANWNNAGTANNTFQSPSSADNALTVVEILKKRTGNTGNYLNLSSSASTPGDILSVLNSGNVGIGNTSPSVGLELGSSTLGQNQIINSTIGPELAPSFDSGNWTATNGWSADGAGTQLTKVTNAAVGTITPFGSGATPTVGVTYKVVITATATSGQISYYFGGSTGGTSYPGSIITATTITDYLTAVNTSKLVITGAIGSTATITSVSIKALTSGTGDLMVSGNFRTNKVAYFNSGQFNPTIYLNNTIYLQGGYGGNPSLLYINAGVTAPSMYLSSGFIQLGASTAGSALIQKGSTNNTTEIRGGTSTDPQIFRVYNTYTSGTNYERLSIGQVSNVITFASEAAGAGVFRDFNFTGGNVGIGTTTPATKLEIGSSDLGDGLAGPIITLGRNTNATNSGAGSINFLDKGGLNGYVWQDAAGNMRINNSAPTTLNDTAGLVIGSQTSERSTKQDIEDYTDYSNALSLIVNAPLHTFRYIREVSGYGPDSPLAKAHIGYIADEVDPIFMSGNVIDQVSLNGLLMASIKELNLTLQDIVIPVDDTNKSFIERFYEKMITWLGSPDNGLEKICIMKSDGSEFCVNGDQLEQAVNGLSNTTTTPAPVVTTPDPVVDQTPDPIVEPTPDPIPESEPVATPDSTPTELSGSETTGGSVTSDSTTL